MLKNTIKYMFAGCVLCLAVLATAEPYRSFNEVCIVEKKDGGYWFFEGGNRELSQKSSQVFGSQRDQFEWFFMENGNIKAKMYPALRNAIIESPDSMFKQRVKACPLTDANQRAASSVSYSYKSQDKVCACLFQGDTLNCQLDVSQLKKASYRQLVLFFECQSFPSVIEGLVPPVLAQAWENVPDDFVQKIVPCSNNTANEALAKQFEAQARKVQKER